MSAAYARDRDLPESGTEVTGVRAPTSDTVRRPSGTRQDEEVEALAARFDELYDRYHRLTLGYFLRRLDDREAAHDAAADVFVVLWRRIDSVPEGDGERPWVYGVCRNVLANHERAKRRRFRLSAKASSLAAGVSGSDTESRVLTRSEQEDLRFALSHLKPDDREVLRLAAWEQLSHAEIGKVFGVSAHAVDQRIHRASRRLAEQMAGLGYATTSSEGGLDAH